MGWGVHKEVSFRAQAWRMAVGESLTLSARFPTTTTSTASLDAKLGVENRELGPRPYLLSSRSSPFFSLPFLPDSSWVRFLCFIASLAVLIPNEC